MRPHTYHTRSGAWASQHHAGTSRVHWPHSARPLSRRTHPFICQGRHHGERRPSSVPPPDKCARTPPSASGGLGSTPPPYCPCTTGSLNPEIHINLSILKPLTTACQKRFYSVQNHWTYWYTPSFLVRIETLEEKSGKMGLRGVAHHFIPICVKCSTMIWEAACSSVILCSLA